MNSQFQVGNMGCTKPEKSFLAWSGIWVGEGREDENPVIGRESAV
jgi:hypothetical protein